jgi:leucyl-tRNA synthetase
MPYHHREIEKKWQKRWEAAGVFHAANDSDKPKFYCLIEFPYPSGAGLHIGHPRSYTALDVVARKRRMEGFNVLYPIGWDAFGLPTENYAIKTGRKPQDVTTENIATFKRQLQALGLSFDWSREVNTTDPEYYKWTQWMFLEFFKAGLAYKARMPINWCLTCKIGLANEEVVDGKCERCGVETEKRDKAQWMIAITKYAERLLSDLESVDYLEKIKVQQRNWIGKSEGAEMTFQLSISNFKLSVFTTRPDTLFGATFLVISPELAQKWLEMGWQASDEVRVYVELALKRSEIERSAENREKTGVATGVTAINPANQKQISVWIADFVLGRYGTGAVFADAHDERDFAFAKKFNIPLKATIRPDDEKLWSSVQSLDVCYTGDGQHFNSDFLNGLRNDEAIHKMIVWLEEKGIGQRKVNYKLRDWVFSRQRYWGEPIPLVWCEKCQWVPVPDDELPVRLPEVEKYEPTDTGESPLAAMEQWVNTTCPKCNGEAKRETDTMPNWAGSSWYFLAYVMKGVSSTLAFPGADFQILNTKYNSALKYWMPVDWYNGGMEHTTLHLLYSRFWNKFLFDRGRVPTSEPYAKRTSHGLILAEDGTKMSKSKGNVINPDEMVTQYGADAVRLHELFMGPFGEPAPWSMNGLVGMRRFLEKVVDISSSLRGGHQADEAIAAKEITRLLHQTIKKVSGDIEQMRFNTAVSAMMIFVNAVKERGSITEESFETFLRLLCPFAPHLANELYEQIGGTEFLETLAWPTCDPELAKEEWMEIGVQVNGKLRGAVHVASDADEETVKELALQDENVKKYFAGQEIKKIVYVPGRILNIVSY